PICSASGVVEWNASNARSKPASSCAFATASIWVTSRTGPVRTMVSDELLLLMNPMNSTDISLSRFRYVICSEAERQTSGDRAGGVVLRRVNPAAQDIAIVPFERIGAGQAVIAGQR